MNIVLLEDDYLQANWIVTALEKHFNAAVRVVRTELEFRELLPELAASPPDVAVLDAIVRWTNPAPDMREPSEDAREGPKRAGLRCASFLLKHCPNIPVILYTVLGQTDLEADVTSPLWAEVVHLSKESSPQSLFEQIRSLTGKD